MFRDVPTVYKTLLESGSFSDGIYLQQSFALRYVLDLTEKEAKR